jgi:hypothetical protein
MARGQAPADLTPGTRSRILLSVSSVMRRACSFVLLLALFVPAAVECAGWKPTAEARKACCAAGLCAKENARTAAGSTPRVSQADADDCCAAAETRESGPSSPAHASLMTAAVLQLVALPGAMQLAPVARWSERTDPRQPSAVPRHLLLSVFLV